MCDPSGRFERVMHIPPPDHASLRKILKIHAKDMPLGKFDLDSLADSLQNFTGADVEAVLHAITIKSTLSVLALMK